MIKLKRGNGVPTDLADGELAYSIDKNKLYIGKSGTVSEVSSSADNLKVSQLTDISNLAEIEDGQVLTVNNGSFKFIKPTANLTTTAKLITKELNFDNNSFTKIYDFSDFTNVALYGTIKVIATEEDKPVSVKYVSRVGSSVEEKVTDTLTRHIPSDEMDFSIEVMGKGQVKIQIITPNAVEEG